MHEKKSRCLFFFISIMVMIIVMIIIITKIYDNDKNYWLKKILCSLITYRNKYLRLSNVWFTI